MFTPLNVSIISRLRPKLGSGHTKVYPQSRYLGIVSYIVHSRSNTGRIPLNLYPSPMTPTGISLLRRTSSTSKGTHHLSLDQYLNGKEMGGSEELLRPLPKVDGRGYRRTLYSLYRK